MNVNDMNLAEITKTLSLLQNKKDSSDGLSEEEEKLIQLLEKRRKQYVSDVMDNDLRSVYYGDNYLY